MIVYEFMLSHFSIMKLITDLLKLFVGLGMCFLPINHQRRLVSAASMGSGSIFALLFVMLFERALGENGSIICVEFGILMPSMISYSRPGANRFVLGFLAGFRLCIMIETALIRQEESCMRSAMVLCLIGPVLIGAVLSLWGKFSVGASVILCTFLGASQIAPVISEWIFGTVLQYAGETCPTFKAAYLFFGYFRWIFDWRTVILMATLLLLGISSQLHCLRQRNISFSTPFLSVEHFEQSCYNA